MSPGVTSPGVMSPGVTSRGTPADFLAFLLKV